MVGSKVGETIVKGAQKIRDKSRKVMNTFNEGVKNAAGSVSNGIKSFFRGVKSSLFG